MEKASLIDNEEHIEFVRVQKKKVLKLKILTLILMFVPGAFVCVSGQRGINWSPSFEATHWRNVSGRRICSMVESVFFREDQDGEHYIFAVILLLLVISIIFGFLEIKKGVKERKWVLFAVSTTEIILMIIFAVIMNKDGHTGYAYHNSDYFKAFKASVLFYVILGLMVFTLFVSLKRQKPVEV